MFSMVDNCISGETTRAKWGVLKCVTSHCCPPSGSAVFLSEIANRRVKMGLKLEIKCKDQLLGELD